MPCADASDDAVFRCRMCGDCCRGYGGTYVGEDRIAAIADYIGETVRTVRDRYCRPSAGGYLLAQQANGFCIFWHRNRCRIHPVKPDMCRQWPYLESVLVDIDNWRVMATMCPGIRADANESAVRAQVRQALKHRRHEDEG